MDSPSYWIQPHTCQTKKQIYYNMPLCQKEFRMTLCLHQRHVSKPTTGFLKYLHTEYITVNIALRNFGYCTLFLSMEVLPIESN